MLNLKDFNKVNLELFHFLSNHFSEEFGNITLCKVEKWSQESSDLNLVFKIESALCNREISALASILNFKDTRLLKDKIFLRYIQI